MIRVLHVIDHLDLGGAQTALLDMLRHRDRSAFDVEVAVMHGRGPFAEALEALGIRRAFTRPDENGRRPTYENLSGCSAMRIFRLFISTCKARTGLPSRLPRWSDRGSGSHTTTPAGI